MRDSSSRRISSSFSGFERPCFVLRVLGLSFWASSFRSCWSASKVRGASVSETMMMSSGGQTSIPASRILFRVSCAVMAVAISPSLSVANGSSRQISASSEVYLMMSRGRKLCLNLSRASWPAMMRTESEPTRTLKFSPLVDLMVLAKSATFLMMSAPFSSVR